MPPTKRRKKKAPANSYLEGQLLLAMPTMGDKRFQKSVIYLCSHSDEGAMGLIINQRASKVTFPKLLKELKIVGKDDEDVLPPEVLSMGVHVGGPVSAERGFVLHTDDYNVKNATLTIADGVCLTATVEILKALSKGKGPEQAILALGYSGWAPGQLEAEIQANGWLHCPSDRELVFGTDVELKYPRALSKIGVDPSHLVSEAGHA